MALGGLGCGGVVKHEAIQHCGGVVWSVQTRIMPMVAKTPNFFLSCARCARAVRAVPTLCTHAPLPINRAKVARLFPPAPSGERVGVGEGLPLVLDCGPLNRRIPEAFLVVGLVLPKWVPGGILTVVSATSRNAKQCIRVEVVEGGHRELGEGKSSCCQAFA